MSDKRDNAIGPPGGMAYVAVDAKPNPEAARKELARVKALRATQWNADRMALDNIRRPVRYYKSSGDIYDANEDHIACVAGSHPQADAIGEFIARLINEAT